MAKTDYLEGHTRRYVSQSQAAAQLGIARNHVARMEDNGLLPTADVWIATYLRGWDPDRLHRFAMDAGLQDADGNRLTDDRGRLIGPASTPAQKKHTLTLVANHYSQPTRTYLGSTLVAALMQRDYSAVYTARSRERWTHADVQVGTRVGWDEQRMIDEGLRSGRIDHDRVTEWALERSLRFDLDPNTDWVRNQAAEHPELRTQLAKAGHPLD